MGAERGGGGAFPPWPRGRSGAARYRGEAGGSRSYHAPLPDSFLLSCPKYPFNPIPAVFEGWDHQACQNYLVTPSAVTYVEG